MTDVQNDTTLHSWEERQEFAELMQPLIGKLYRTKGIEVVVYGRSLVAGSTIDIIKAHRLVRQHENEKLRLRESFPFLEAMAEMDISNCRIDLGKIAFGYVHGRDKQGDESIADYLNRTLAAATGKKEADEPRDVVLYGFGRIGRLLARLLIERNGRNSKLRL